MATYSNQHWLLSHIRNSFISTDDTGMCETVMVSDDLPKHYLRKFQTNPTPMQQPRKSASGNGGGPAPNGANVKSPRVLDPPLQEGDFMCYPGLDESDDEDMDLSTESFDIQMYSEVGPHRLRSNTAQKLEKMDIARRKAARTKNVNFDDEIIPPERSDFFVKKPVVQRVQEPSDALLTEDEDFASNSSVRSKLSLQMANSPKQSQNKFMEYARFDGTSQTGIQTKRINVFLNMLPEKERNYPIKICVIASAKIIEVIGLVCYKATMQYPDIPLKSIRHYALYMTEDNDDMEDFPPLDNREPCSKFGFSHLTLAERRPSALGTGVDLYNNPQSSTKSMTSEEIIAALMPMGSSELAGGPSGDLGHSIAATNTDEHISDYEDRMVSHNDMLEAPMYRTYRVNMIDKRFFKTEITLGVSGERIEIDHHKNAKFWTKQKAVTYPIEAVAFCEIVERRNLKSVLRIWLKASVSSASSNSAAVKDWTTLGSSSGGTATPQSPNSPGHYAHASSPFAFFTGGGSSGNHQQIRFKHFDFETDMHTAEQIFNKLNCILKVRSSEVRREFIHLRERKLEKHQSKKHLKLFE